MASLDAFYISGIVTSDSLPLHYDVLNRLIEESVLEEYEAQKEAQYYFWEMQYADSPYKDEPTVPQFSPGRVHEDYDSDLNMEEQISYAPTNTEGDAEMGDDFSEDKSGQDVTLPTSQIDMENHEAGPKQCDVTNSSLVENKEYGSSLLPILREAGYYQIPDYDCLLIPGLYRGQSLQDAATAIIDFLNQPDCDWKHEVLGTIPQYQPMVTESSKSYRCTVKGCLSTSTDMLRFRRHVKSHFGSYIFCPSCGQKFKGAQDEFSIKRHLTTPGKQTCYRNLLLLGWIDTKGSRFEQYKPLFNLYFLGLFEDIPIHDEHFLLVAGRDRSLS